MVSRCRKMPGRVQARKIKIGQFWGVVFHIADKHVTKVVVLQAGDIKLGFPLQRQFGGLKWGIFSRQGETVA